MRIGLFLECKPTNGGAFQQSFSTVQQLLTPHAEFEHEIIVLTPYEETRQFLLEKGITAQVFKQGIYSVLDRCSSFSFAHAVFDRVRKASSNRFGRHLDAFLDDHKIDLAFFNDTTDLPARISDHPFVVTLHDVDHRDHPEFPEAFFDRRFGREEQWNAETLIRAAVVITNVPYLAERIHNLYHVDARRIVIFPFVPSHAIRSHTKLSAEHIEAIRNKYQLPGKFVFYPAAFLPHKNHVYLLEGLSELRSAYGIKLGAVFSGHKNDLSNRLEQVSIALGLEEQVRFLDFVPEPELVALYKAAFAVTVPSYFGPTNLQPIEAVVLDRPVICSDLIGCREQLGDAALYCELGDPKSLAANLAALELDQALCSRLSISRNRLAQAIAEVDYRMLLLPFLREYEKVRKGWTSAD
jgi:glycosyltransferase involved in cell wall biosynthesis